MSVAAVTEALATMFLSDPAWLAGFHVAASACIIAPLLIALKLNRRWSATRRHQLCRGAAVGLLLVSITPLLPTLPAGLVPAPASLTFAPAAGGEVGSGFSAMVPADAVVARKVAGRDEVTASAAIPENALLWIWLSISSCLLARLLVHAGRSHAIARRANALQPQPESGVCTAPVLISHQITGPITVGLFSPRIVLPVGFRQQVTPPLFAAALRHEDAHARRRDNLDELFYRVLIALFWFNPLLFALNRQRACIGRRLATTTPARAVSTRAGTATS